MNGECKHCGYKPISSTAKVCPKCGGTKPYKQVVTMGQRIAVAAVGFIVYVIWLMLQPTSLDECLDSCDADYINTARRTGNQNGDSLYTCKQRCRKQFQ
jgi:hypothetical protein